MPAAAARGPPCRLAMRERVLCRPPPRGKGECSHACAVRPRPCTLRPPPRSSLCGRAASPAGLPAAPRYSPPAQRRAMPTHRMRWATSTMRYERATHLQRERGDSASVPVLWWPRVCCTDGSARRPARPCARAQGGPGVAQDLPESVRWFSKAAEQVRRDAASFGRPSMCLKQAGAACPPLHKPTHPHAQTHTARIHTRARAHAGQCGSHVQHGLGMLVGGGCGKEHCRGCWLV